LFDIHHYPRGLTAVTEWLYKATRSKLDHVGTMLLAKKGFLCRSAFTKKEHHVANVQAVEIHDILNFYYIVNNRPPRELGRFEIVSRDSYRGPLPADTFGELVPSTALYIVENPAFLTALAGTAYSPDPVIGKYTGWLLERLGHARASEEKFLSEMPTLVALS